MLEVKNLSTYFFTEESIVRAVDQVSFFVNQNEILGLVGESGSGKSTVALSILRLVSSPGKIISGKIIFKEQDLLQLSEAEMIKIRGAKISLIFQDPFTTLNPVFTVGEQIAETIRLHQRLKRKDAWQKAIAMLEMVQIPNPTQRVKDYPHQFSGGMRQRVMIAMALACQPELLIADEPTTALDVTIQAEILKLLKEVQKKFNLGIIYITHNLGIVKEICDRVVVIQQGRVVEEGGVGQIFQQPKEVYTRKLIDCLKILNP